MSYTDMLNIAHAEMREAIRTYRPDLMDTRATDIRDSHERELSDEEYWALVCED